MLFSRSFIFVALLAPLAAFADDSTNSTQVTQTILDNAAADHIDLSVLPQLDDALASIQAVYADVNSTAAAKRSASTKRDVATIIDVHSMSTFIYSTLQY
jgi:hypothetical protein